MAKKKYVKPEIFWIRPDGSRVPLSEMSETIFAQTMEDCSSQESRAIGKEADERETT